MESEFVESEYEGSEQQSLAFDHNASIPMINPLDSGSEDYRFSSADSYLRHPNSYLPRYNIQSETEGEFQPLTGANKRMISGLDIGPHQQISCLETDNDEEEDIPSYGFPRRNRREPSDIDILISNGGNSLFFFIVFMTEIGLITIFLFLMSLSF